MVAREVTVTILDYWSLPCTNPDRSGDRSEVKSELVNVHPPLVWSTWHGNSVVVLSQETFVVSVTQLLLCYNLET